jgi:hypothetical protein
LLTAEQLRLVKYCAQEVERQHASPVAVYWLVNAFAVTSRTLANRMLTAEIVEEIGRLVEPIANMTGFRECAVRVGHHIPPVGKTLINSFMNEWCGYVNTLDRIALINLAVRLEPKVKDVVPDDAELPDAAYVAFQTIHPFRDGNGRTGKVLRAMIRGDLTDPTLPPNYFNIKNP